MKKLFLIFSLFLILSPNLILAKGLVPCGGPGEDACTLCHLFVMISGVIDYIIFKIVPPLAVLLLLFGGILFLFAGADPNLTNKGKSILKTVVIGILIVYGAWLLVDTILAAIGVKPWLGNWSVINC